MAAEIREITMVVNGIPMRLVHADVWDPGPSDADTDRATVYYEDEERPHDAIPLYRLEADRG